MTHLFSVIKREWEGRNTRPFKNLYKRDLNYDKIVIKM